MRTMTREEMANLRGGTLAVPGGPGLGPCCCERACPRRNRPHEPACPASGHGPSVRGHQLNSLGRDPVAGPIPATVRFERQLLVAAPRSDCGGFSQPTPKGGTHAYHDTRRDGELEGRRTLWCCRRAGRVVLRCSLCKFLRRDHCRPFMCRTPAHDGGRVLAEVTRFAKSPVRAGSSTSVVTPEGGRRPP